MGGQLKWLPPNVVATPVQSPAKRGDLPVFSSSGVIPFAPRPGSGVGGAVIGGRGGGGVAEGRDSGGEGDGRDGEKGREVPESPHY